MVISIEETREMLGEDAKDLSDSELKRLITSFELLAQFVIKKAIANE